jgi:hypothetical protein
MPSAGQRQPGRFRSFDGGRGGRFFYPRYRYPYYYPYGYDPYFYGGFGIGLLYGGYYPGYGYYDPYYYDGGYSRDRYDETPREEKGGINLDISPADTRVFIDGKEMGSADDFDGWPDYLWLDPGTYDLVLYKQGYKTVAQQVTVYPGKVLDLDEKMETGASTRPEDLATKTHERRDSRIQYERDRSNRIDRYGYDPEQPLPGGPGPGASGAPGAPGAPGDWRDRARSRRDSWRPSRGDDGDGVRLDIEPGDASVYLDGRFIGTGRDVARGSGLHLSAGPHKLAVVRPGRKAKELDFDVKEGQPLDLSVRLESSSD